MSMITDKTSASDWSLLDSKKLEEIGKVCNEFNLPLTDRQILINTVAQRLHFVVLGQLKDSYLISTALNGVGQKEGTGQTPLGLHFVHSKIGKDAKSFEVFKSRISTGETAVPEVGGKLIVGRILWLQGAQIGFNQGKDVEGTVVDSLSRYIYIHGTNDLANLGNPVSGGCVRMKPDDVVALFEMVPEKTPVYIYKA